MATNQNPVSIASDQLTQQYSTILSVVGMQLTNIEKYLLQKDKFPFPLNRLIPADLQVITTIPIQNNINLTLVKDQSYRAWDDYAETTTWNAYKSGKTVIEIVKQLNKFGYAVYQAEVEGSLHRYWMQNIRVGT